MEADEWDTIESVAAPEAGPEAARHGVYARMAREGYAFDFFQAVRLLEQHFSEAPAPGTTTDYAGERVRIRPDVSIVFPATDIKRVDWKEGRASHVELVVTFMGLYGVDSPLPYYLYDLLDVEGEDTSPQRDFLDVFNHRIYAYFYRAWKKYRPLVDGRARSAERHERRILSLAGIGTPNATDALPVAPLRLASLAGWLGRRARCAEGLEAVVSTVFGVPATLVQNVARWVVLRERRRLGGNSDGLQLGTAATIGERVYDRSSKFRLRLGPLGLDDFVAFLPGGKRAAALHRIVRLYAPDHLAFDVELRVRSEELPPSRLGDDSARLGLTTCLGRPTAPTVTRQIEYAS